MLSIPLEQNRGAYRSCGQWLCNQWHARVSHVSTVRSFISECCAQLRENLWASRESNFMRAISRGPLIPVGGRGHCGSVCLVCGPSITCAMLLFSLYSLSFCCSPVALNVLIERPIHVVQYSNSHATRSHMSGSSDVRRRGDERWTRGEPRSKRVPPAIDHRAGATKATAH